MPLLTIKNLSIGFRGPLLLDDVSATIDSGQKIGLLGRNGAGKTTLMRILAGELEPDSGTVLYGNGPRVAILAQDVPRDIEGQIGQIVQRGLQVVAADASDDASDEAVAGWEADNRVKQVLDRMGLERDSRFEALSSGMKRRVLLAKAIVQEPDLLLLDEPTNHLDVESIEWLEGFLAKMPSALMFVTHDREFLQRLANRIWEVDRGRLFDWSCDYKTFLKRKEQLLLGQEKQDALFDKKLAEEEVWIRQGIKARRTRNQGRVRSLQAMRQERSARQEKLGISRLKIQDGVRSGNIVINADSISHGYDDRLLIDDLSTTIMRGDKIGVIGPNGAGKTTLLKILLGELEPQQGKIKLGVNLQVAYFDQLREQLDPEQTILQSVSDGSDFVMIDGNKNHVIGYMQEFLFTPERTRTKIKFLSGGERNRILLAKLFAKPANLIVLDEPTNDLDAETLELLEERLVDYSGTIVTVSHDRAFLDNVVTSSIVFESRLLFDNPRGDQRANYAICEYTGGYGDWLRQRTPLDRQPPKEKSRETRKQRGNLPAPNATRKLKFKEQRELETLPSKIETLETEIASIHDKMSDPSFFQRNRETVAVEQKALNELEVQLTVAYARWEELESFVA